ncbi:uncharacterized protein LOC126845556 isoform X2 [Adelges cooleyi]|uniref:uncharacterized protein LOC126845556 isoform X2 n=1 Tax=Adelges cooleyi TaxID=133065 RepID=UPI002180621B|nr:uncharacterized protein LOC126845556 isoform X2 [Adelges cooleyi]
MDRSLIFLIGTFSSGDWLVVLAHVKNYASLSSNEPKQDQCASNLREFSIQFFWSNAVGYAIYIGVCGYLEWSYYTCRREIATEWKCQPRKWSNRDSRLDQIKWGVLGLFCTSSLSAVLATNVACGGYSTVYLEFGQYSWQWWILQWPVIFVIQDYTTYWIHRMYHTPFLYKRFHCVHHRYYQPTPWSVTAIHPVEIITVHLGLVAPMFTFPVHWFPFSVIMLYLYYHGIIQHSGINLKARWWQPWQPDVMFHDIHHQFVHVNFGFNCYIWDQIHGTNRNVPQ